MSDSNKCANPNCINQAKVKYCSRSCSATVSNSVPKRKKNIRYCHICSTVLKDSSQKYCSPPCMWEGIHGEKLSQWLDGSFDGSGANGDLRGSFRNWMLAQADYKCTLCGWNQKNPFIDKVILTIDHIDGNWQNNKRDNLIVLCYNCHTLTPTFCSLNKNSPGKRHGGPRAVR